MRALELSSSKKTWKIGEVPLAEWMEWALSYADKIDPVAPIRRTRQVQAAREVESQPPA